METTVEIIGVFLILTGYIGSVVPAIPGPPTAYLSLIVLLFFNEYHIKLSENNYFVLISLGIATILITILDFYLPVWGTKKFGGTPSGTRGSTIGLIIAILLTILTTGFGVFLLLLGPFIGAYLGEKISGNPNEIALKSALGSFLGFISGTLMKLVMVTIITLYFAMLFF